MEDRSLLDQILQSWRVNNSINIKLIQQIPRNGFAAVPLASRGRTVLKQLMHMHKVHVGWLKFNGETLPAKVEPFRSDASPTRAQLVAAFRASGRAVEKYIRARLESGERIRFFQGKPVRWMCYVIAHDSHHRGQIALALKQNKMKLPEKVSLTDLWYSWYGGDPK